MLRKNLFGEILLSATFVCVLGVDYDLFVGCLDSEFQCPDGRCIDGGKVCDGFNDCGMIYVTDESEELCDILSHYGCQSELEFQTCGCPKTCGEKVGNCSKCEAGCHCPENLWRFEAYGQLECVTEEECPVRIAEKIRKEKEARQKELNKKICGRNEFQCPSGECINGTSVCDGWMDCYDDDYSSENADEGEWCEYLDRDCPANQEILTCGCSTSCNDDYECNYCVVGCQCKSGYLVDEVGECVPEDLCSKNQDVHPCDGVIDPCYENGHCLKEGKSYRCICYQNYWGQNCEMRLHPCDTMGRQLCSNRGECLKRPGYDEYKCSCHLPFAGDSCERTLTFEDFMEMFILYGNKAG